MKKQHLIALSGIIVFILSAGHVYASDWAEMVDFSGYLESDIRYIIEDYRGAKDGDGYEFEMNRNDLDFRLDIYPNENVQVTADTRLRFYGFNESASLPELASRDKIDPFSIYLEEAYVSVRGLFWEGIDFKIGRMIQNWGAADQINPTDNLNAHDYTDPLDYTAKVPNQMIELDIYPTDWMSLTFVWVPVFKPSMLPPSSSLSFAVQYGDNGCFKEAPTPPLQPSQVEELADYFGMIDPCSLNFLTPEIRTVNPKLSLANSQAAARAKFSVGDLDFSLSYFYGRFTFPTPVTAAALINTSTTDPGIFDVKYIVELMYPKMHVAGFDFSYSADWLFDIGFVGEIAVIFPEEVIFALQARQGNLVILDSSTGGVSSDVFPKATVGIDYNFTSWLYANAMYVRGFVDEFNDMYGIHNYVIAALEFKFLEDELVIRAATAFNADDLSATVYPQITWVVFPSVQLIGGVLWFVGDTKPSDPMDYTSKSKFGQKGTGRNVAFLKARVNW